MQRKDGGARPMNHGKALPGCKWRACQWAARRHLGASVAHARGRQGVAWVQGPRMPESALASPPGACTQPALPGTHTCKGACLYWEGGGLQALNLRGPQVTRAAPSTPSSACTRLGVIACFGSVASCRGLAWCTWQSVLRLHSACTLCNNEQRRGAQSKEARLKWLFHSHTPLYAGCLELIKRTQANLCFGPVAWSS